MLSSIPSKTLYIRTSKIIHKSSTPHQLTRFVTEEAVCLMFGLGFEDICVVECWRYVVYVHAKGVSKFVSYADFPPIEGVKPPSKSDFIKWRKRWRKHNDSEQRKQAPQWWAEFFTSQFCEASSESMLYNWSQLVELIQFAFPEDTLEELRKSYHLS